MEVRGQRDRGRLLGAEHPFLDYNQDETRELAPKVWRLDIAIAWMRLRNSSTPIVSRRPRLWSNDLFFRSLSAHFRSLAIAYSGKSLSEKARTSHLR